jgi:hypothetical protein
MALRSTDRRTHRWSAAVVLVLSVAGVSSGALAQVGTIGPSGGVSLMPPPVATNTTDPLFAPTREYSALPLGGWLVYPSMFVGALWDSNPTQSPANKPSSPGGRFAPSLLAEASDGINKTTLYGMGDFRGYTDQAVSGTDTLAARAGVIQRYQPTIDWVVTAQADYARQRDLLSAFGIDNSVTTLNTTAVGLSPIANSAAYNQYSATGSLQKNFGQAFVIASGSVVDITYDNSVPGTTLPSGTTYTGGGRAGFWFTPFLYAYGEGTADQRHYSSTSELDSSGYRVVGGIGTDQIGLFKGELFGGYQAEDYSFAPLNNNSGAVFGGSIYYSPLPYVTVKGSVNETLGVALLTPMPGVPGTVVPAALGTSTKADTALIQASYALAREWSATGRFGYVRTSYTDVVRADNAWVAGVTLTYSVWLNFGITLDYQYLQLASNVPLQSFTRDVVTLGATYRY